MGALEGFAAQRGPREVVREEQTTLLLARSAQG